MQIANCDWRRAERIRGARHSDVLVLGLVPFSIGNEDFSRGSGKDNCMLGGQRGKPLLCEVVMDRLLKGAVDQVGRRIQEMLLQPR